MAEHDNDVVGGVVPLQATDAGQTIRVEARPGGGDTIVFAVEDEGTGVPEALARYEGARVGRARFVVERSSLQVPRMHSPDPDSFRHDVPIDEALGLFNYDPARVPV